MKEDVDRIRVSLCQTEILWENKEKNIEKAENFILESKRNGAEIVFFPEMSFTGFSMNVEKTKENNFFTVEKMKELAKKHCIAIGFGWVKEVSDKASNCYTVVSEVGKELVTYTKIHSFRYGGECDQFVSGDSLHTFEYKGFTISPYICYDLRFPEIFRATKNVTNVYIVAANWPESRREHWRALIRARAIENQAYLLGINCVGNIGGISYSGDSLIVEPDGTIKDTISGTEGIIYADLEKKHLDIRKKFPVFDDCRGSLYMELLEKSYEVKND